MTRRDSLASGTGGPPRPVRPRRVLAVLTLGLLLALLVRVFLVESFFVPSPAMEPAYLAGDRVLVRKQVGVLHRGEVVVADVTRAFEGPSRATPRDEGLIGRVLTPLADALGVGTDAELVISRVVAVGGDEVSVVGGTVIVDGEPVRSGVTDADVPAFVVPGGHVWLLGDNHRLATDSLTSAASTPGHGSVADSDVVGTVWLRFWPLGRR